MLACGPCRFEYPILGSVAALSPLPEASIAMLRSKLIESWVSIEWAAHRARGQSERAGSHKSLEGTRQNHAVLERCCKPVIERGASSETDDWEALVASLSGSFSFKELLPYFYVDWTEAPELEQVQQLADEAVGACSDRESALVLGCGACGLLRDIAPSFANTYGLDTSLEGLLFARALLDGASLTIHLKSASWASATLAGAPGEQCCTATHLALGDAACSPVASASVSLVTTQYLLDIVPDAVIGEINRVLRPGGIWFNFGVPFRLGGEPDRCAFEEIPQFLQNRGFETLHCGRRHFEPLNLTALDEWAPLQRQTVNHFTARKRSEVSAASRRREMFASYFRGDSQGLMGRVLSWGPGGGLGVRTVAVAGGHSVPTEAELRAGRLSTNLAPALVQPIGLFAKAVHDGKMLGEALKMMGAASETKAVLLVQALEANGVITLLENL
jgi:SAM-dependent methyltransferase